MRKPNGRSLNWLKVIPQTDNYKVKTINVILHLLKKIKVWLTLAHEILSDLLGFSK